MMKKFIVVAAVVAALGMTACSSSSSSTTTTSTTVNGITTTTEVTTITENGQTRTETVKTVTDENGNVLSVTDENGNPIGGETAAAAETEAAAETGTAAETEAVAEAQAEVDENDPTGLRAKWHELFFNGAEGENADGDHFFFACNDSSNVTGASMMILNKDMTELNYYYLGNVEWDGDEMVIYDVDGEHYLPVTIGDGAEEGTFTMAFKDGDMATMHSVDQDVIINDMVSVVENLNV